MSRVAAKPKRLPKPLYYFEMSNHAVQKRKEFRAVSPQTCVSAAGVGTAFATVPSGSGSPVSKVARTGVTRALLPWFAHK